MEYFNKSKLSICALSVVTGLPGSINYFLLYLVKINKISKYTEKYISIHLNTWIRSPGCCFITFIGLYALNDLYKTNLQKFFITLINTTLIFWNGQYYMMKTCIDYGNKTRERIKN